MRAAYDAAAPRAPLTEHSASKVRGPTLSAPRDVYMCRRAAVRVEEQQRGLLGRGRRSAKTFPIWAASRARALPAREL